MYKKNSKKGFTLVELVIVILIIAILFVVLVPQLSAMVNKAKTAGVQEDFREFSTAAQAVAYEQGGFIEKASATDTVLKQLNANLDKSNEISGTDAVATMTVKDPWNVAYKVEITTIAEADLPSATTRGSVKFTSAGADGNMTTADDNLTITVAYTAEGTVETTTTGFSLNKSAN